MSWECDTLLHFHVNMRWKSFQTLPLFSCVFCSLLLTLIYFCSSPFSQAIVGTGKTMKTLLKHVEAFKPKMIKVAGWVAAVKTLMGEKNELHFPVLCIEQFEFRRCERQRQTLSWILFLSGCWWKESHTSRHVFLTVCTCCNFSRIY